MGESRTPQLQHTGNSTCTENYTEIRLDLSNKVKGESVTNRQHIKKRFHNSRSGHRDSLKLILHWVKVSIKEKNVVMVNFVPNAQEK